MPKSNGAAAWMWTPIASAWARKHRSRLECACHCPPGCGWRFGLAWIDAPDGRRAFTDRSAQSLVVLHLSPRDSLRLIQQQTRFNRHADTGTTLAMQDDRGRVLSVMLQHRTGLSRIISLGLNRAREQPGAVRASEVFAKATLGY